MFQHDNESKVTKRSWKSFGALKEIVEENSRSSVREIGKSALSLIDLVSIE